MVRRSPQEAGDILHRKVMILFHRFLERVAIEPADLSAHEGSEFLPEVHRIRAHLPRVGFDCLRGDRTWVVRVTAFVPIPRRFKPSEHAHYLQHRRAYVQRPP
jgi:hypothetical protein